MQASNRSICKQMEIISKWSKIDTFCQDIRVSMSASACLSTNLSIKSKKCSSQGNAKPVFSSQKINEWMDPLSQKIDIDSNNDINRVPPFWLHEPLSQCKVTTHFGCGSCNFIQDFQNPVKSINMAVTRSISTRKGANGDESHETADSTNRQDYKFKPS